MSLGQWCVSAALWLCLVEDRPEQSLCGGRRCSELLHRHRSPWSGSESSKPRGSSLGTDGPQLPAGPSPALHPRHVPCVGGRPGSPQGTAVPASSQSCPQLGRGCSKAHVEHLGLVPLAGRSPSYSASQALDIQLCLSLHLTPNPCPHYVPGSMLQPGKVQGIATDHKPLCLECSSLPFLCG